MTGTQGGKKRNDASEDLFRNGRRSGRVGDQRSCRRHRRRWRQANGGSVTYLQLQTYDNLGPDAAQLVRTAISQGVDGIAVPNWVPEAEDEAIKAAIDAGIKVILINAGNIDKAKELGAVNYVGSDEYLAGVAGGEYFGEHGQKNVICVNTVPGAANLEARCKGVVGGVAGKGGAAKQLPLPATSFGNPTAVAEAIKATLLQDGSIDGVITISATDADSAAIGIAQAGKTDSVKLGTFDLNQMPRFQQIEVTS
jgi:simple sugar transport system substrate-binding protein